MGHAGHVRIVVTQVAGDGSMRRGVLDTADRSDADKCEELIEQATLAVPPLYRPAQGKPIYQIRAGDNVVLVAEGDLAGPLRELVMVALANLATGPGPGGSASLLTMPRARPCRPDR
jgi:hypothetical protein